MLVERVEGLTPIPDWIRAYEEINAFERTLADDGTVILKFWLHIPKDEQLRRFVTLTQDPSTAWEVTAEDWEHHRKYDEYYAAVEDMLNSTNTEYGPWDVIPSTHKHYKTYAIFSLLIARLEEALDMDVTEWPSPKALEKRAEKAKAAGKKAKASKKDAKRPVTKKARKAKEQDVSDGAKPAASEPEAAASSDDELVNEQEGDNA